MFYFIKALILSCRGATFREVLLKIGEVRSLLPEKSPVMALTATATYALRLELENIIGMKSPTFVVLPPRKPNLTYKVTEYVSIEENCMSVLEGLKSLRTKYPRTIVYCRSMEECMCKLIFVFSKQPWNRVFSSTWSTISLQV